MGMHRYRPPVTVRLPEDPVARVILQSQARSILAQRLKHRLPRIAVVERTGIYWKRVRGIEEGSIVARLDELVKLASLFSVQPIKLIREIVSPQEMTSRKAARGRPLRSVKPSARPKRP